jgi:hypothetical protein
MPEQWRDGLRQKIAEVKNRQGKDWNKRLNTKQDDTILWLGE